MHKNFTDIFYTLHNNAKYENNTSYFENNRAKKEQCNTGVEIAMK